MAVYKENIPSDCRTIQDYMVYFGAKNPPVHVRPDGALTTDFLTIGLWGNIRNETIISHGENAWDIPNEEIIQRYYKALKKRGWRRFAHQGVLVDEVTRKRYRKQWEKKEKK